MLNLFRFSNQFKMLTIFFLTFNTFLQAQMNVQFQDTLQQTLANFATNNNMQGVASAVVFPDGTKWSGVVGQYAEETQPEQFSLQDLNTNVLFDIGSNTKSMTAAIILLLEEENVLSIDDTLYTYLNPIENVPYGITLKQLLQHQSGIASYTDHSDFGDFVNDINNGFLHPDSVLAKFLDPPLFASGSNFYYSNTNYLLLGQVIEVVENKAYHEVLQDRIFTPHGLDEMYLDQYHDYAPLSKAGTWFGTSTIDPTDYVAFMSAAWAAGAVISKPEDFAFYCYQLCRGDILNSTSMDKMTSGINTSMGIYGLGLIKSTYKGRTYLNHGGTTLQNSEMHYSTETDFSVVVNNIDYGFNVETNALQKTLIDLLENLIPEYLTIDEINTEKIGTLVAFPNPATEQIQIQVLNNHELLEKQVEVYNVTGKLIYSYQTENNSITLKKEQFGSGIYWVKVSDDKGVIGSEKIIFN